jgi:XTP/dITP diphosphohydrolase
MLRVVCASANPHKVAEIYDLVGGVIDLEPRPKDLSDVAETETTLIGNARLKAIAVGRVTNQPALADDTGLEVDALNGQPGVFTARFAGPGATDEQNRHKLLDALNQNSNRSARFRTVILLLWPDGKEIICEGVCEGSIAPEQRGDRGFGYDSVFVPAAGDGRTFAQMSVEEKHQYSHRAIAFRLLAKRLGELPAP